MVTTINAYSVSLGLDASSYIDASKISRSETAMLKRDIAAARTPVEELAIAQARLDKALQAGAITQDVYNRLLEQHADKARKAAAADTEQGGSMLTIASKFGNVVSGIRNGIDLVGNAVGFVVDKFDAFNEIADKLDATADKAKKLGLSFNELGSLEFAASRLGGEDALGAVGKALGELMKRGFVEPGENAVDAFRRVAEEISGMSTQTERAQRASELFGKSGIELLAVLQAGSGEIGALADQWERTNGLTNEQLEFISEYNDKLEDVMQTVQGIASIYVAELAPAMAVLADKVLGLKDGFVSLRDNARLFADTIVVATGNAIDLYEVYAATKSPLDPKAMAAALDFSTGDKMLEDVLKKREALTSQATKDEIARNRQKNNAAAEDFSELIDGNKAEWDKFAKDRSGFQDLINGNADAWDSFTKDRDKANKMATQAAEEAQRRYGRIQSEVAKGPGTGIEVGSADAARFMAQQVNAAIGSATLDDKPTAGDEAIIEQLKKLLEEQKQNRFSRIR
jgi:hypothetical protein